MKTTKVMLLACLLTSNTVYAQVIGGRDNSEMSPKVAEATKLSGGGFVGDVNIMTGEYSASIPLGSVSTPAGLNYSLELNYSSAFSVGASEPLTAGIPFGEGWSPNIPTVSIETAALHKFSCFWLSNSSIADTLDYNRNGDPNYRGRDEGDLFWFSPMVSIPGVGSGRAIFKYVDKSDGDALVFVLNAFEQPIELRYYGNDWVVKAPNGTRYEFSTHMANYTAPSNQRNLFYNQQSLGIGPNDSKKAAQDNAYGVFAEDVMSAIEPKASYSVWYCNTIMNTMYPLQGIRFVYDTYGKFNYFKEFDQIRYQQVRTDVLFSNTDTDYSAYSDVFLKEVHSYLMDSPYEKIEMDYATLRNTLNTGQYLEIDGQGVERMDSLYSRKVVKKWDANFNGWQRYKHPAALNGGSSLVNSTNPYIANVGQASYIREGVTGSSAPFDHGFLESPRVNEFGNSDVLPGDIYELRAVITRSNPTSLQTGNGTLDIAIVTGNEGAYSPSVGAYQTTTDFENTKGVEIYSTFNMGMKWQMGFQQGKLVTSNLFRMPNVPIARGGFNIQIGPGNSDIDFGGAQALYPDFVSGNIPNVQKLYPHFFNTGRQLNSVNGIPHNFGTGHPWGMMIPIYNKMALSAASILGGSAASPNELYDAWWATSNDNRPNIPTKFDDNIQLDSVELIRYSKNPYMLQGVRVYRMNGESFGIDSMDATAWQQVSQKRLEYSSELLPVYKNKDYATGTLMEVEQTYSRLVILLDKVREVPVDSNLYANNYGVSDTAKVLTTYLSYTDIAEMLPPPYYFDPNKPYQGYHYMLLDRYVDHLGQSTAVRYYPFEPNSPSRWISNYTRTDCDVLGQNNSVAPPNPFGHNRSYSMHAAVDQLVRNDENDIFAGDPFAGGVLRKRWMYQYATPISNPKQLQLPYDYFRGNHFVRADIAFGKVRVIEPNLDLNNTYNYTDYEYFGNTDATLSIQEYLYYGKLKSSRNYEYVNGTDDILHEEKLYEYGHTLAFENAWERPNYIREQLGYDHLQARSYEYEDIYLGDDLELSSVYYVILDTINGVIIYDTNVVYSVSGDLAKLYAAPAYLTGRYSSHEQARLLDFYFYEKLLEENPAFMLQSYFVKKTSERHRIFEDGLAKPNIYSPGPVVPPEDKSSNPHGTGIVNTVAYNSTTDDPLIQGIQESDDKIIADLLAASPLSNAVLSALASNKELPSSEMANVFSLQQGLSNGIWEILIDKMSAYPPHEMEQIVSTQPYFSDSTLHHLLVHADYEQHSSTVGAVLNKNAWLSDPIVHEFCTSGLNLPGEVFADVIAQQSQCSESILSDILASSNLASVHLSTAMENQHLSDTRFIQIIDDAKYTNQDIVRLLETTLSYPSDSAIVALFMRSDLLSEALAQRALAAAPREIGQEVLDLIDEKYSLRQALTIKPPLGSFNPLNGYCNAEVIETRKVIENRTDYEYYEADFKGRAVGKAYELLFGLISAHDEPSAFPFTITTTVPAYANGMDNGKTLAALTLKHEPSWQLFASTQTSPQHPNAHNREEYFYYYDLQNRYDRHWFNYSRNPSANLAFDLVSFGNDMDTLVSCYNYDPAYSSAQGGFASIPLHDGMLKSRQHASRDLAFQKSTLTKNSRDAKPLLRSEYYFYNSRWKFDDLPKTPEIDSIDGPPCPPTPPGVTDCEWFLNSPNIQAVFYKPFIDPLDITPFYYCLWEISNQGFFVIPSNMNVLDYCGDAILIFCNEGVSGGTKLLPIGTALAKTLLLRDVTVQVDTVDHSTTQEFENLRLDPDNHYIAEFYTGAPNMNDNDSFPAPHKMVYPFDHLTVRTIDERNRYLQAALEHNQVGLKTRYYYTNSSAFQNFNTNCQGQAYSSVVNENIGLPMRICVGYERTDSLSTAYEYTAKGQVKKVIEPSGRFMAYSFDAYLRLDSIRENDSRLLTTIEYNNWLHDFGTSFNERTEENFVQTRINNADPLLEPNNHELRKAFLDPLARNQSVISAYKDGLGDYRQIHSGSVKYDNWGRVIQSYKNFLIVDPLLKADTNYLQAFAETIHENDPKSRALRSSNYGVAASANEVVRHKYSIANNVFASCELNLNAGELSLIMGPGPTANYAFFRSETHDQDSKRSVEYSNAFGQKVATLSYNGNQKIVTLFVYDSYGNLTRVINPEKQSSYYHYNILGQLIKEKTVDAGAKHYLYNKQGLVSAMQDDQARRFESNGNLQPFYRVFKYDIYGRLLTVGRHTLGFDYNFDNEYGPLTYKTTFVGDYVGMTLNAEYSNTARYFDYKFSNASTQDWLLSYVAFKYTGQNFNNEFVTMTGFDNLFVIDKEEKVYAYGLNPQDVNIGKLVQTFSCDNDGMRMQKVDYYYNTDNNIVEQIVRFNANTPVGGTNDLVSKITYPKYNYRNSLLEERVDVDNDGNVDFQYFMHYDALNRLEKIYAASGQVAAFSDATLLVSYTYDDVNGLLLKKEHRTDQEIAGNSNVNRLVMEIEYAYDVRDRLTNVSAGQFSAGLGAMMDYSLFYDSDVPYYLDGNNLQLVNNDNNYNGNINGTIMRYNFQQNGIGTGPSSNTFAKPTLYGYTYDKINRLTMADATIGDYILPSGSISDIAASYAIGNESISYDRIGNIQSLERRLKGIGSAYTEIEFYNYVYNSGSNQLIQATGMGGTATRQYTYDPNGNLLLDTYRNITGTEYGRAAYTYHLDKGSTDIDYRYSIDDQRVFKREVSTSGNFEDYYLMDAMGKTVALRSTSNAGTNWEYYINGAEREARIVPSSSSTVQIEAKEPYFYLYDHLGNTRVVYKVDGYLDSLVTVNKINFVADYFPYGKIVRKYVSGEEERFLTTQHERDEETGLDYRGARYYDSDVARFLSLDPLAAKYAAYSPYCYVAGNPIILVDMDGKEATESDPKTKVVHGAGNTRLELPNSAKITGVFVDKDNNGDINYGKKTLDAIAGDTRTFEVNGVGFKAQFNDEGEFNGYWDADGTKYHPANYIEKGKPFEMDWERNGLALVDVSGFGLLGAISGKMLAGAPASGGAAAGSMRYAGGIAGFIIAEFLIGAADADAQFTEHLHENYSPEQLEVIRESILKKHQEIDPNVTKIDNGNHPCFVAGTMISTSAGFVKIENIESGDTVSTINLLTQEIESCVVLNNLRRQVDSIYYIRFDTDEVMVTSEHPFYVLNIGWTKVKNLKKGDEIVTKDDKTATIQYIDEIYKKSEVYNLQVEKNKNYFVSSIKLLVHNKDCFSGATPILLSNGNWIKIKDVVVGDSISIDGINNAVVAEINTAFHSSILKLFFGDSTELVITPGHPLLLANGSWASFNPQKTCNDLGVNVEQYKIGDHFTKIGLQSRMEEVTELKGLDQFHTGITMYNILTKEGNSYIVNGLFGSQEKLPLDFEPHYFEFGTISSRNE